MSNYPSVDAFRKLDAAATEECAKYGRAVVQGDGYFADMFLKLRTEKALAAATDAFQNLSDSDQDCCVLGLDLI